MECDASRGCLRDIYDDLLSDLCQGSVAGDRQSSESIDFSKEDAQIAAVRAQLAEEHARIDKIVHNLGDTEVLEAEKLLLARSVMRDAKTVSPLGYGADADCSSSDEDSDALQTQAVPPTKGPTKYPTALLAGFSPTVSFRDIGKLEGASLKPKRASKLDAGELFLSPEVVVFQGCAVGGSYETRVEVRNSSLAGIRLQIMPCTNKAFTNDPIKYESSTRRKLGIATGLVPPGVAVYLTVRFTPKSLDDQADRLVLASELGNVSLPVHACDVKPPSLNRR